LRVGVSNLTSVETLICTSSGRSPESRVRVRPRSPKCFVLSKRIFVEAAACDLSPSLTHVHDCWWKRVEIECMVCGSSIFGHKVILGALWETLGKKTEVSGVLRQTMGAKYMYVTKSEPSDDSDR
jgi:hypothetical protein